MAAAGGDDEHTFFADDSEAAPAGVMCRPPSGGSFRRAIARLLQGQGGSETGNRERPEKA